MTPEEEDALVVKIYEEYECGPKVYIEDAIRLAIRAAVAHERERCAKVCEALASDYQDDRNNRHFDLVALGCADAIRRGE